MFEFAKRLDGIKPSIAREMYKVIGKPGYISFASGAPSAVTFPNEEMAEIAPEIYRDPNYRINAYGITEGDPELREFLRKRYIDRYGFGSRETDDLQIFTGGQQILDLTAKAMLNEGDVVLVDEHSYSGAMTAFRAYGAKLVGVKMDENGMIPEALAEALETVDRVKMIYLIPTFQNPMGVSMPFERRKQVYELAVKYNKLIFEDSPYFELRYSGEYIPAIKSLDTDGHVLFAGSLSKIVAPGLRIGFAIGCKEVLAKLTLGKQQQDLSGAPFTQQMAFRYMSRYDLDEHIQQCCTLYREKRDIMLSCLEEELGGLAKFSHPEGGLFLWVYLPEGVSGDNFGRYLLENKKLTTIPGSAYQAEGKDIPALRLNFSVPDPDQIRAGVKLLGEGLREFMQNE